MKKLSKQTRTVLAAVGALAVLGIIAAVLLLTKPSEDTPSGVSSTVDVSSTETIALTNKQGTDVTLLEVSNETGSFSFRQK